MKRYVIFFQLKDGKSGFYNGDVQMFLSVLGKLACTKFDYLGAAKARQATLMEKFGKDVEYTEIMVFENGDVHPLED